MMQVWKIDDTSSYTGESYHVEEPTNFEIAQPVNTNEQNTFYNPKWNGEKWVEGWLEEEIQAWKDSQVGEDVVDKTTILERKVEELELINGGLLLDQAQQNITINEQSSKLEEQEIVNANLLLEVAMLKQVNGGM